MKILVLLLLILVSTVFGGIIQKGQNEPREFELLDDLDKLIVVFADEPVELSKNGAGSGSGSKSSEEKEEGRFVHGKIPDDWIHIWNEAALKIVLDGAANELYRLNSTGKMEVPDIIVGDLDTITSDTKKFFEEQAGVKLIRVADQHKTDLDKALDIIFGKLQATNQTGEDDAKEFEGILILGPLHGRFDLTLGTLHGMVMHTLKFPNIPIMALDGINFVVMLPRGQTKLELKSMEFTGKSGLFPMRQRHTKVFTKGFQWNLGKEKEGGGEPERQTIEYGTKLSCSNKIQAPNDLQIDTIEPVLFTLELKKPNCVLSKMEKKKEQ